MSGLTLYGSEDVSRAGHNMVDAARQVAQAADTIEQSTRTLEQLFGQGYGSNLDKLIESLDRCPPTTMSIRDQLAALASEEDIKEMMLGERDYRNCRSVEYTRQQARYRHADAMLKARTI